jgi:hypothetical protein
MGDWVHTEAEGFGEFVEASLARARSPEPWAKTAKDESLFRGTELTRALVLAQLGGSVRVTQQSEANPIARVAISVDPAAMLEGADPVRGAAMRVLATTDVIMSAGRVDASDLRTSSRAGDVGVWPIVVGVSVVSLGAIGFLGYCVHEYTKVADNAAQRVADFQKLKEVDAHALILVKQHTDREAVAGKQLALDEATRAALAGVADAQRVLAEKQSVDPPKDEGSGFSPTQLAIGAGVALAAIVLLKK